MNAHTDPAQFATASVTLPPLNEWVCSQPIWLGRGEMGLINEGTKEALFDTRKKYRKFVERVLMRHLVNNEYLVLSAVLARTLSFSKLIEKVPMEVFIDGIRDDKYSDAEPELVNDEDGIPYFEGTGLTPKTIRSSLNGLREKGVITTFQLSAKTHKAIYAYSAMSMRSICVALADYDEGLLKEFLQTIDSQSLFLSMWRDPVSELEERFTAMFPIGVGFVNDMKERHRGRFERYQASQLIG